MHGFCASVLFCSIYVAGIGSVVLPNEKTVEFIFGSHPFYFSYSEIENRVGGSGFVMHACQQMRIKTDQKKTYEYGVSSFLHC